VAALLLALLYLLVICVFIICGLEFLALATYLIYLGAVIVLLIFVLMMLQTGYIGVQFMFYENYFYELIIITASILLGVVYKFINNDIFSINFLKINSVIFFDLFELQTTFLVDFGFLLYQIFFIGVL